MTSRSHIAGKSRGFKVGSSRGATAGGLAASPPVRAGSLAGGRAPSASIWEAAPPLVWSSGGMVKRASGPWWPAAGSRTRGRGGGSEQTKERTVFSH
jgi:hypothetical protein